jgi:hypothetical protein
LCARTRTRPLRAGLLVGAVLRTADAPKAEKVLRQRSLIHDSMRHKVHLKVAAKVEPSIRALGPRVLALHGASAVRRTAPLRSPARKGRVGRKPK